MPTDEKIKRCFILKILAAGEVKAAVTVITAAIITDDKLGVKVEPDSSNMLLA